MVLNIKDPETDELARRLAELTGQTITSALREAIEARIATLEARERTTNRSRRELLDQIAARGRALPDLDRRSPEEIIGYDERGLPA